MVNKFFRKANSLLLAAAMAVTMMPVQMASAADTATPGVVQPANEGAAVSPDSAFDVASIEGKVYTVIEGNTPALPKKANVSADNGIVATEIQWTGLNNLSEGEQTVTGTAGGTTITVKVNVLHCDEEVEDVQAMGRSNDTYEEKREAIHPLKGYKGKFVTEYDIVPNDVKAERDRAVIYLPAADKDGVAFSSESAWDYGARLQFKKGSEDEAYFQTQIGDGQDKDKAVYYPTDKAIDDALAVNQEIALPFKKVNTYHVRTEMDTTTDKTKGNVKIYITDPDGIEHEVTQEGGNGFRIYPTDGVVKSFAAMRGGYRLINHKVSWISGYATKKVETYVKEKGVTEYVKEAEVVETKEVPDYVANQKPDAEITKDSKKYVLDTDRSGWYNGDTKLESITVAAGDTVTYRAYYKDAEEAATIAAKEAMDISVAAANKKLTEVNEEDYTPASWTAFTTALQACKDLPATATKDDYVAKKSALDRAMTGLTGRADKAALNQAIEAAKAKKEEVKKADYTPESWSNMEEKLAAAETVYGDVNATQTEVDTAKNDLLAAVENLTLAVVTPAKYTVTFNSNGGSKVTAKTVESGKKVAKPNNPTKKGYTFAGWYNGKTKYNFSSAVKKDLTLTAKWTKVTVKAPSKPTLKNSKSKQMTITIKKVSGAAGYQVTYSTDKKFKKKVTKKDITKNTLTIKKLKKNTTYYVKVKAYKKDSKGKKVYSSKFSGVAKIKIKK